MIKPNRLDAVSGYAVALIVAAVAMFGMSCVAHGAGVRRVVHCNRAVQSYVAPVYKAAVAYAPAYYAVGQHLQKQAVDTNAFRQSAEYLEYLELKGFERATVLQAQKRLLPADGPHQYHLESTGEPIDPSTRKVLAEPENQLPSPPPAPSGNTQWDAFKLRYPTIAAKCASCHGQKDPDNPEGGLYLNGAVTLEGDEGSPRRDAIIYQSFNGHMPKAKPLTDAEFQQILVELYADPGA